MAIETDFANRTALITGAASGIGAATAAWLDQQGVGKLILVDRDEKGLAAHDLSCKVQLESGDVCDPDFWNSLDIGTIDHALVNAGVAAGGPIAEMDFAEWRRILSINLDGAFLTLQAAMKAMSKGGSIVLTASVSGQKPMAGASAYGTSKAALIHLSKCAALEGAPANIRVNAIAPGGVETAIWDGDPNFDAMVAEHGRAETFKTFAAATPSGRFASAEEIAGTIGYLLSGVADNITGAVLSSDGGFSL